MSQVLGRDEKGAEIAKYPGRECFAWMLTDDDMRERFTKGPYLPYRFIVYHPSSCATNWTAFFTRADLDAFCTAYDIRLSREPQRGARFALILPESTARFQPLDDDGTTYDPAAPCYDSAKLQSLLDRGET
jgi:hypothetical protein